jgi:acetyl esterase/lipase
LDIEVVDPSLRAATRRVPALRLENGLVRRLIALGMRAAPGKRIDGVQRRTVHIGSVRARVYTPTDADGGGLLWIHGGGLVIGAARMDDRVCGETAQRLRTTIVSVDYRLAPKHPFPAALDDCHAAWRWLTAYAGELGIDVSRVVIGGQSAGGGLAACLVQRLHDEGARVAGQWLFCPMLDDRTAADRTLDGAEHFVWDNRANLVGWSSYLGAAPGAASVPAYAVAARRADLSGLPPAWIYASDIELFHDEAVAYARRLEEAGVAVTLEVVHGAPHGFESWATDTPIAQSLLANARAWLGERLSR